MKTSAFLSPTQLKIWKKKKRFCQPDVEHMMFHHWEHFRLAPCNSPASRSNLDKYLKIFENIYFLRSTFVLDRWYWYLDLQAQPWLQWSVLEKTSCLPWFPICLFVYLSGQSLNLSVFPNTGVPHSSYQCLQYIIFIIWYMQPSLSPANSSVFEQMNCIHVQVLLM